MLPEPVMPDALLATVLRLSAESERLIIRFPLSTIDPVPRVPEVPALPTCNVPALIVVPPEYVFTPVRSNVDVPLVSFVNAPAPLITPDNVCAALLLYSSVPAFEIAPA